MLDPRLPLVCLLLTTLTPSCGAPSHHPASQPALTPGLATLGIKNGATSDDFRLLTAAQITREQFAALPELGFSHVICLREASEEGTGWEEAFAAEHGMRFTRMPITKGGVNEANANRLAEALDESSGRVLLYCGSSNRVGAMLAAKAHWSDGMPAEDAIALGRKFGLTRMEGETRQALGLPASQPSAAPTQSRPAPR